MPALSILLPTYNGARFLGDQVASILNQDFADFELLMIDDGSRDDTPELLSKFASLDPRIRVLPSVGNEGQKRRLGTLIAAAVANHVAISDQDDIWATDKLGLLMGAIGDAALAFGDSHLIDGDGREMGRTLLDGFVPSVSPQDRLTLLFRPTVSAHAMVARRALVATSAAIHRVRPFDWLLALEAAFSHGIVYVPQARTDHRLHGGNQMNGGLVGRKPRIRLLDPRAVGQQIAIMAGRRANLLTEFEHLAHSTVIPFDTARRFADSHAACTSAWYDPLRSPFPNAAALMTRLTELLRPLAGDEADWRFAEHELASIAHPPVGMGRLYRQFRRSAGLERWH